MEELDIDTIITDVTGYATTALLAAVGIGTAVLAWSFVKRFIKKA